jgi:hypothetical protein
MKRHWPIVALSIFSLAMIDAAYAGAKHRRHAAPVAVPHARAFEPARMIVIRPGLIISSYDCVTDEGYGRYYPCSGSSRR